MLKIIDKNPILIIFATSVAIEICKVTGWVAGPSMQRYFALTNTELGLVMSALSFGALLMSMGTGFLTTYMGLWRVWKLGIWGSIAAMLFFFFAGGFWTVFLPLFLLGIMHVLTLNANNTYLSGAYKEKSMRVMSLAAGLWFGSSVISTPLIGLWVQYAGKQELGRMMFLVPYAIGIVLLVALLNFGGKIAKPLIKQTEDEDREFAQNSHPSHKSQKKNIFGWFAIMIISFCHGSMLVGIISWANPMVQQRFGVGDFHGSLTFAALALGLSCGRLTAATGIIKSSTRVILTVNGLVGGLFLLVSMFAPGYWITIAALTLGGLGVSTTAPCLLTLVPEHFPAIRSHIYGHIGTSISIAGFATPWVIGALADSGLALNIAILISPISAIILGSTALIWKLRDKSNTAVQTLSA